jgi:hypothetical protein
VPVESSALKRDKVPYATNVCGLKLLVYEATSFSV